MGAKLKAASVLILMFCLGLVSGIAWQIHHFHHARTHDKDVEHRIAQLKKELDLSPWQEQALTDIIADAHERAEDVHEAVALDMAQIHEDSMDAIEHLLTPAQRRTFERLHDRRHAHLIAQPFESETGVG